MRAGEVGITPCWQWGDATFRKASAVPDDSCLPQLILPHAPMLHPDKTPHSVAASPRPKERSPGGSSSSKAEPSKPAVLRGASLPCSEDQRRDS